MQEKRWENEKTERSDVKWHTPCLFCTVSRVKRQRQRHKARRWFVCLKGSMRSNSKDRKEIVNVEERIELQREKTKTRNTASAFVFWMKYRTLDSYIQGCDA